MADREDIYRWLQGASWRHTTLDQRKLIEGLIAEGRAEWVNPWNRARAIPNPIAKPKRDYKSEAKKLRAVADAALSVYRAWDRDLHYTNKMFALGRELRDAGYELRDPSPSNSEEKPR